MAKDKPSNSVDFFISYATPEEAMAREIGAIIEDAGYSYVAQFRDFVVGTNFVREMQRGLAASSRLIALLSPAYEHSHNCQAEWSAAYYEDPGSQHGKIIPFQIAEGELNPLARQIVYKSLVGLSADLRRAAVLDAIEPWMKGRKRAKTAGRSAVIDAEHGRPKPSNLPSSINNLFKGREEFLARLRESFRHNSATAITGKAVHGLGGVGKTRAAIEYGHAFAGSYAATFFLIGKSESDLRDSLAALAGATVLDLPEKNVPDLDGRVAAVIHWLRDNPGWLLIIDNVDNELAARAARVFLDQVSRAEGHVLLTSRVSEWGHIVEPLELDLLSVEAAKDLLRESTPHRTKRADEDAGLTKLAYEQLGCLSLALVQAGAYVDARRIGFADYAALFDKEAKKLLAKLGESAVRNLGYPLPVALTWQASITQLSDGGRLLLDMLSWLSIEPIPRSLFAAWPGTEAVDLDEALAELTRYSLIHWEDENSAITVHRLVAQVTRNNQNGGARDRSLGALFPWLVNVNPDLAPSDIRCWPQLLPLLPHALQLFERTSDSGPYENQTVLYTEYATLLVSLARYSEAEPLFQRALAIDEASHGPDHSTVAGHLSNLALLLRYTNRLAEAEPLYRRALEIGEASDGPEHPQVAIYLVSLAALLSETHRLSEAEPLYRRALTIDEASYGTDHPEVATDLNNLATLLQRSGRLKEAEPLLHRALKINEASHGPDHPTVAIRLNNLAEVLRGTDRFREAEPNYRRAALIMLRSSKASGHLLPHTAGTLQNYVFALGEAGRKPEARSIIASILAEAGFDSAELWTQVFGPE